jgi:hypothetical protein
LRTITIKGERFLPPRDSESITFNYTVIELNGVTIEPDNPCQKVLQRNIKLLEITRYAALFIMMLKKFSELFSGIDVSVCRIIAQIVYEFRYDEEHLKTLAAKL